ncbi:TetR family transcriptional regulator [Streptomyces spiralis]|uniref:TetR family transcriptional regulator n=1 Tax=Streptomyces spiralis TaxID=66376 RepID=A0A919ASE5_9ACTN|nr:TetR/AcrR family transcriptional regulator [Streptomyces spiralis]GHF21279.1 TetR family transcriptional regulator [Streptomyces spiralis]
MGNAAEGARARARIEVTAAIKNEARRQLAAEGSAKLSLRTVVRELGMVASALYRYYPSRDDLLTALVIDAHNSLGETAEADEAAAAGAGPVRRWIAVYEAARDWALTNPHEYALIFGTPFPGRPAPDPVFTAAARVGLVLMGVVRDAHGSPGVIEPPLTAELRPEAVRMAADLAFDPPPETVVALVAVWAQLFGLVGFELSGRFNGLVEEREAFSRHAVSRLAHAVGLV